MFVLDVVIQTAVVGAVENPGKMNVMLVDLVINQIRIISNEEDHRTVSEMVDLVPVEEVVLAGMFKSKKKSYSLVPKNVSSH